MGKASVKKNKNIYQLTRESLSLTRDEASELLRLMSPERIERIENERQLPHADDVLIMAQGYKAPHLCNYFCSCQCPIGQEYIPRLKEEELSSIVLRLLSSLNSMQNKQDSLVSITADGNIDTCELSEFVQIQRDLEQISSTAEALRLWCRQMIAQGRIDTQEYNRLRNSQE
ncbi:MAG: XRE family transcriptional regulator [Ruminococcus sp.]|nr:XRE family transcriptional regulator [Ruminococcus sp.]